MLSALLSLLGIDLSIQYHSLYFPQTKIVQAEEIEPLLPVVVEEPPKKEEYNINCYCVPYVRQFLPNLPRGNADDFQPNTTMREGVAVLLSYSQEHIAYVEKITSDGLLIKEANYERCKATTRLIKWEDLPLELRGFYDPTLLDNSNNTMEDENIVAEELEDETSEDAEVFEAEDEE